MKHLVGILAIVLFLALVVMGINISMAQQQAAAAQLAQAQAGLVAAQGQARMDTAVAILAILAGIIVFLAVLAAAFMGPVLIGGYFYAKAQATRTNPVYYHAVGEAGIRRAAVLCRPDGDITRGTPAGYHTGFDYREIVLVSTEPEADPARSVRSKLESGTYTE